DSFLDNHDGVMKTALDFSNELLSTTSENKSAGLSVGASGEEVETLSSDLSLFEQLARSEMLGADIRACRLDTTTNSLHYTVHIIRGHSTSTENITIGKELCSQITNRKLRENDLGSGVGKELKFSENDLPFGVDDCLVFGNLLDTNLGVVLLTLYILSANVCLR